MAGLGALAIGVTLGWRTFAPWFDGTGDRPPPQVNGVYIDEPLDIVDFRLTDQSGRPFTRDSFTGHWTLIYFGYTFCPDACPMTLSQLRVVQQSLAGRNADADNAYLLISVDPARDTPQRLAEYVKSFGEKFQGATGSRAELDKLTESMGIYYRINEPEPGKDYYLVDHASALVLVNPDARLQAVLTPPFTPQTLESDLLAIKQHHGG